MFSLLIKFWKSQRFYIYILSCSQKYFFTIPVLDLAKHFFHDPVLIVLVPTNWSQLASELQEPDPELSKFSLQTKYPPNTSQNSIIDPY
jgi:hypothetical protein